MKQDACPSAGEEFRIWEEEPSKGQEKFDCGVIHSVYATVGDVTCIGTRGTAKSRRKVHLISSFAVVSPVI